MNRDGQPDDRGVQQHQRERDGQSPGVDRVQREMQHVERRVGDHGLQDALVCPRPAMNAAATNSEADLRRA